MRHGCSTLLEAKAHDATYGGYVEFFNRDWSAEPADVMPYLGVPHGVKTMNTHLHLMEALTAFYRASQLPLAATRLAELITIQSNTVVRKAHGACTDQYARDWTPRLAPDVARASYGHDLENIWLLVDAHDALGLPIAPQEDLFRTLFANALAHGYDRQAGGFYDSGPLGLDADRRGKIWWVQAESLVSALTMYQLTGDAQYADVFRQTWQFVNDKQTGLGVRRVVRSGGAGRFDRRRQGASVEGGLPQRPRASRMLCDCYPSPAARSP